MGKVTFVLVRDLGVGREGKSRLPEDSSLPGAESLVFSLNYASGIEWM